MLSRARRLCRLAAKAAKVVDFAVVVVVVMLVRLVLRPTTWSAFDCGCLARQDLRRFMFLFNLVPGIIADESVQFPHHLLAQSPG